MPQVTSLLNKAVEVVYVCASLVSNMPKYGGRFGSANLERNEWMVDRASLVWAYNPNKDIGTQHVLATASKLEFLCLTLLLIIKTVAENRFNAQQL